MNDYRETIIITGAAGFIGFSLVKKLLISDYFVIGIDNLNNDLQIVKHNSDLMKNHISFIEKLYQTMRKPIDKFCSFFS